MTDKVQKIREEVVRLKEETSIGLSERENGIEQGRMEIINAISLFLDSLQEEPASEELEQAAVEAFKQLVDSDKNNFLEIFKAGAKWKKQQTISKACKWIDKNAAKYLVDRFVGSTRVVGIDTSITEDFRKDMED